MGSVLFPISTSGRVFLTGTGNHQITTMDLYSQTSIKQSFIKFPLIVLHTLL